MIASVAVPAAMVKPPEKVFLLDRMRLPVPDFVSALETPVTRPEMVNCEAVPATLMVLSAPSVTAPDKLLVPVVVANVPPFRAMTSVPTVAPCKSKVAPLATVTPPAVVPSPVALVMAKVPDEMVVAPV